MARVTARVITFESKPDLYQSPCTYTVEVNTLLNVSGTRSRTRTYAVEVRSGRTDSGLRTTVTEVASGYRKPAPKAREAARRAALRVHNS